MDFPVERRVDYTLSRFRHRNSSRRIRTRAAITYPTVPPFPTLPSRVTDNTRQVESEVNILGTLAVD